ncbi:TetR/AcrR family transcriptional regulator [Agromyces sp. LHK192]|uniref:TetR/AcrR family transcriptional regulator n=1 Tax=Agromyces sp. LHK192 TaxID=2498704 RepID=UPI000FD85EDF|nr:TetR/AcrR family transcriptional regulator [Agromyces sp. LHK192]
MPRVTDAYRAERLDDLFRATWRCIAEIGIERTTITDIIRASGFSAGMVYNYFASKDELVDAAQVEAIRRARGAVEAATARPTSGPDQLFERTVRAVATRPEAGDNAMLALWVMNVSERSSDDARAALAELQRFAIARFSAQAATWPEADGGLPSRSHARADAELLVSIVLGFFAQQRFAGLTSSQPLLDAMRAARRHRAALRRGRRFSRGA